MAQETITQLTIMRPTDGSEAQYVATVDINDGAKAVYMLGSEDYIILPFTLVEPVLFKVGDYVDLSEAYGTSETAIQNVPLIAKRYVITEKQQVTYDTVTGGYKYELKMEAEYRKWKNHKYLYQATAESAKEATFTLTTSLANHMMLFLDSLKTSYDDAANYTYEISNGTTGEAKTIQFSNVSLLDALANIAKEFDCDWWVEDETIHMGRCEHGGSYSVKSTTKAIASAQTYFHTHYTSQQLDIETYDDWVTGWTENRPLNEGGAMEYVWAYSVIEYEDGTSEVIPPHVVRHGNIRDMIYAAYGVSRSRNTAPAAWEQKPTLTLGRPFLWREIRSPSHNYTDAIECISVFEPEYEYNGVMEFRLGKDVETMQGSAAATTYATRVYAYGSTRNISQSYVTENASRHKYISALAEKRLMLPNDTGYIDAENDLSDAEVVEEVKIFDDIYPRTKLKITEVTTVKGTYTDSADGKKKEELLYRFKCAFEDGTPFNFTKENILDGEDLSIVFQLPQDKLADGSENTHTPLMLGMEFGVAFNPDGEREKNGDSWNSKAQLWQIVPNETYGKRLPEGDKGNTDNNVLIPKVGDTFALLGWDVFSSAYSSIVTEAQQELQEATEDYIEQSKVDPTTYECGMMTTPYSDLSLFDIGTRVLLRNKAMFERSSRLSRIIGYTIKLDIPSDHPIYKVGERKPYSRLEAMQAKLAANRGITAGKDGKDGKDADQGEPRMEVDYGNDPLIGNMESRTISFTIMRGWTDITDEVTAWTVTRDSGDEPRDLAWNINHTAFAGVLSINAHSDLDTSDVGDGKTTFHITATLGGETIEHDINIT